MDFSTSLNNTNWDTLLSPTDANDAYNSFHEHLPILHNLHFPLKTVKFNKNCHRLEKWMTPGILISRITKYKLEKLPVPHQLVKM